VLAVPGSNAKMAAKAASLAVDQVMLDLEDAVAPAAKPQARVTVADALNKLDWNGKIVSVRVNAAPTRWFERDVLEVVSAAGARIDTIVLPKAESGSDVRILALTLARVEREQALPHAIRIEPQIESARGLLAVDDIARADKRVVSLTFGPADYAASIGSPVLTIGGQIYKYPGHVWHYPLARIVVAAKAAGLAAIDGPYGNIKDEQGLNGSALIARALGCDGKWAIHPDQIAPITNIFTPGEDELARARRIAQTYERLAESGETGAISYEGELLDAASVRLAAGLLARTPERLSQHENGSEASEP
jgi:citrate lyase beta subunit